LRALASGIDRKAVPESVVKAAERVSEAAEQAGITVKTISATELKPECFPPCVKRALAGVPLGYRNFAIAFFLPTFLSRARIPSAKPEDSVSKHMPPHMLVKEIFPIIEQAAAAANPPLFSDQPQERENILRKLGLDASCREVRGGRWYMCPSCSTVAHSSDLCRPDELCKRIKNPLSYYVAKLRRLEKQQ